MMRLGKTFIALLTMGVVAMALFTDRLKLNPPFGTEGSAFQDPTSSESNERFKRMNGATWLSEGGVAKYSDDCIGCPPYGDISVYHNTENRGDLTDYTYRANCGEKTNGDVVERSEKTGEDGSTVGKRCVVRMGGETRVFWTEGQDEFWIIGAPTADIAKEFEVSDEYLKYRAERLQYVRELMVGAVANRSNPR